MSRRRARPASDLLRDLHFTTRHSTQRDWRPDEPAEPAEKIFQALARSWFAWHS